MMTKNQENILINPNPNQEWIQPAEWAPHQACWLAWPSQRDLWNEYLEPAQKEFLQLCAAIADVDPATGNQKGDFLEILVVDSVQRGVVESLLKGLPFRCHEIPFGDIWLRDTGPIFVRGLSGEVASCRFGFNGWGGKYNYPHDGQVAARIAQQVGMQVFAFPWVLEGGSVDVDGQGTCLTTSQCLLNPNRNPKMNQAKIESALRDALGADKVLWLKNGLFNDHTDGHIDNLARFVAPGHVVCMESLGQGKDPNHEILQEIASDLEAMIDAQGRKLQVDRIPSPGKVVNLQGAVVPASYMNFYISNSTVVIPTFGSPSDSQAVERIGRVFPNRRAIGSSAYAILCGGGGTFHCITQQQPQGRSL
jgi:agmatine deiminase